MAEPQLPESTEEEADTEEEFKAHFAEGLEAQDRLTKLARDEEASGNAANGRLYRELVGVVALVTDMAASSGGAFVSVEESIDDLYGRVEGEAPSTSSLLKEDASDYQQYFTQVKRLLDGLIEALPAGTDEQRKIFETLLRMTNDRIEFTTEITLEDEPEDDEPEEVDDEQ